MGILSDLASFITNWVTIAVVMAALGIAAGLLVFVFLFPGKPKIGVIDIPFTVITEDSAFVITEYLNYARRDDSIKAVVIKLTSPGGWAAASERLYVETRKLREEKPVVLVMNDLVASGGYMMSMGASHTYAQTTSLVGNVGLVSFNGPLVPPIPDESVLSSGPYKISGFTRDEWISTLDELKDSFAHIVLSERGSELRITEEELVEAKVYTGLRAVRLGLVDELGGDSDAFRKAAEMAGISNYGLVDVNLEVLKEFVKDFEDIFPSADKGSTSDAALSVLDRRYAEDGAAPTLGGGETGAAQERLDALLGLVRYGRLGVEQDDPLPGFPMELSHPNFYYLYVGDAR